MPHPRGDAFLRINGEEKRLRLTLGALADIEAAFGGDVETLKARLARPRAGDVIVILHALIAGGGAAVSIDALKASDIDIAAAAAAIAEAFSAVGADGEGAPGKSRSGAA